MNLAFLYLQNIYNHIISTIKESEKDNNDLNIYSKHVQTMIFVESHDTYEMKVIKNCIGRVNIKSLISKGMNTEFVT